VIRAKQVLFGGIDQFAVGEQYRARLDRFAFGDASNRIIPSLRRRVMSRIQVALASGFNARAVVDALNAVDQSRPKA